MYKSGDQVQWSGCGFTNAPARVLFPGGDTFVVVAVVVDGVEYNYLAEAGELTRVAGDEAWEHVSEQLVAAPEAGVAEAVPASKPATDLELNVVDVVEPPA